MLQWLEKKRILYLLTFSILLLIFMYLLYITFPFLKEIFIFIGKIAIPFLIAAFIAYLLHPLVTKLQVFRIHRGLAVLLIYILFFTGVGLFFYRVYPQVVHQMKDLTDNFPQFIQMYDHVIANIYEYTAFLPENVHNKMDNLISRVETSLDRILSKLVDGFLHIFDMIIILTVIPVLVFYYLKDFKDFKILMLRFIPRKNHQQVKRLAVAMDEGLGGYIRGQLLVSLFVALTGFITLTYLEIPYALILSLLLGITNIIPYFGPIIGALPIVFIAYTISFKLVIYVLIIIFIIQIIEGNLLSPYIMGKNIKIHPIAIILVLLIGGDLFGIVGMILAVPLLTIGKVFVRHAPGIFTND